MRCPYCTSNDTRVVDSRPADGGESIRRRRECARCNHRFTTYERSTVTVMVLKRDDRREPFDPLKVRAGVENALADRPVSPGAIDDLVARVSEFALGARSVGTDDIGKLVLAELRRLDEVAYLRFASVYKDFQGARDFEREMAELESGS